MPNRLEMNTETGLRGVHSPRRYEYTQSDAEAALLSKSVHRARLTSKLNVLHDVHLCTRGPFGHHGGEDVK